MARAVGRWPRACAVASPRRISVRPSSVNAAPGGCTSSARARARVQAADIRRGSCHCIIAWRLSYTFRGQGDPARSLFGAIHRWMCAPVPSRPPVPRNLACLNRCVVGRGARRAPEARHRVSSMPTAAPRRRVLRAPRPRSLITVRVSRAVDRWQSTNDVSSKVHQSTAQLHHADAG